MTLFAHNLDRIILSYFFGHCWRCFVMKNINVCQKIVTRFMRAFKNKYLTETKRTLYKAYNSMVLNIYNIATIIIKSLIILLFRLFTYDKMKMKI